MALSPYPSKVNLPQPKAHATVLAFLIERFPSVSEAIWINRVHQGKVHFVDGREINETTAYEVRQWVCYYREVEEEAVIPFPEEIIYHDAHVLIAYKPHFLPVMPAGNFVNECLQNRLRKRIGMDDLIALHRLDRDTAGLVMFSLNAKTRSLYHALFSERRIQKYYQAVAAVSHDAELTGKVYDVNNRLIPGHPSFLMRIGEGQANASSQIYCEQHIGSRALFGLQPHTGRTHQLRVHMQSLGWPILNDRFYPTLQPKAADDYAKPLQLLAKRLSYIDPVSGAAVDIECPQSLSLMPSLS